MDNAQEKISALLSDPENLKTLAGLASAFMAKTPENSANTSNTAPETAAETPTSPADNSTTTPSAPKKADQASTSAPASTIPAPTLALPDFGAIGGILGKDFRLPGDVDKSIGLLNALKPCLGSHKRKTCEIMVQLLGAAKALEMFNKA